MIRIGVISDTHLHRVDEHFKNLVQKYFDACDYLFHAGDFVTIEVLEYLKDFMKDNLMAVCGNMDRGELQSVLPRTCVCEFEGVKIGLVHGWGPPQGIEGRLLDLFKGQGVRIIVFGHTHAPANFEKEGVMFFNPGSPTDKVYAKVNTIGILKLEKGKVEGEIVEVKG